MLGSRLVGFGLPVILIILGVSLTVAAQNNRSDPEFGPVVRAYLGYLRNEQEVVDDRASRHEVSAPYYRRNSNRIHALRQIATQIARDTQNDYLPELEAVAGDELGLLFERPPRTQSLKVGEVLQATFRYLGSVRAGEVFYVFARLDPYEQADQMARGNANSPSRSTAANPDSDAKTTTRARRVSTP